MEIRNHPQGLVKKKKFPSLRLSRQSYFHWIITRHSNNCSETMETMVKLCRPCLLTHRGKICIIKLNIWFYGPVGVGWVWSQMFKIPLRGPDSQFTNRSATEGIRCQVIKIGENGTQNSVWPVWPVSGLSETCSWTIERSFPDVNLMQITSLNNAWIIWVISKQALGSPRAAREWSCTPKLTPWFPTIMFKYRGLHAPNQSCFSQPRGNSHYGIKAERLCHKPCQEGQEDG